MRCESLPVMSGEAWLGQLFVLRDVTEERAVATMRGDLIRTMVHDLRNPLTAINGALELLSSMVDANWETHSVKLIEAASLSSHQMLTLVSSILDLDRLASGHTPVFMQSFNLREVVAWECAMQKPLALAKGIQLTYQLPDNLPPAWGDRETIRRVLQNLLGNALKFTPDNGRVHLDASQTEREGEPALQVTVQDSGPGIDPKLGERLFEQFAAGRHPEAGSGLGLAYCKMALDAHDQQIWAGNAPKDGAPKDGAPKDGAIFTFTLAVAPDFPEVSQG
jgi:signal transduction histidine kinase